MPNFVSCFLGSTKKETELGVECKWKDQDQTGDPLKAGCPSMTDVPTEQGTTADMQSEEVTQMDCLA